MQSVKPLEEEANPEAQTEPPPKKQPEPVKSANGVTKRKSASSHPPISTSTSLAHKASPPKSHTGKGTIIRLFTKRTNSAARNVATVASHPLHLPLKPPAASNLPTFLKSFVSLDEQDISPEAAAQLVAKEVLVRHRIQNAKHSGLLKSNNSTHLSHRPLSKHPSSSHSTARQFAHHDHLVSQTLFFSHLMSSERRSNIARAKKIAAMVQAHFKRKDGATERDRKEELRRIRQLAKFTAHEVRKKWKLAQNVWQTII